MTVAVAPLVSAVPPRVMPPENECTSSLNVAVKSSGCELAGSDWPAACSTSTVGGVASTVHVNVWSAVAAPSESTACTVNVCEPSLRPE